MPARHVVTDSDYREHFDGTITFIEPSYSRFLYTLLLGHPSV